jgi:hypothetical protein
LNPRQVVRLAAHLPEKQLPGAETYLVSPSHHQARRRASIGRREEDLRFVSHMDRKCHSRLVARNVIVHDALPVSTGSDLPDNRSLRHSSLTSDELLFRSK